VRVRAGDTLGGLARRFGTTVARLRADNGLQGNVIHPGQRLALNRAGRPHGAPAGVFRAVAPLRDASAARIVSGYGQQTSARNVRVVQRNTGIELAAMPGEVVTAAAPGIVRFFGALEGLGHVVIVEHADGYRTVYCPMDAEQRPVEIGEAVRVGQSLGTLGTWRWGERPVLRFEIRRGDAPVDPLPYLDW
jgi:murein DD-endopeptidase MepM/ murein hydrolase activator NlpD